MGVISQKGSISKAASLLGWKHQNEGNSANNLYKPI